MKKEIYLDNAASTQIDGRVIKEIKENLKFYANASSKHTLGIQVKEKIESSRNKIAKYLNCNPDEIFFTSGGTESNNTILKGISGHPTRKEIIISKIEHASIMETCDFLERQGYIIKRINVDKEGIIDLKELEKTITPDTLLVSIMHVNNEIGTIQPIEKIAKICSQKNVYFHSDMVQSLGKIKIDLKKLNIDFASFSGHKINAPKGIGFMFIKRGIKIEPLIHGGNQEKGLRSGTENFLGITSIPIALNLKKDEENIRRNRDYLLGEILKIPGTKLNGSRKNRVYNNINVSFYGIEGESLLMLLANKGIHVSTGSACSSNKLKESYVLNAIKIDPLYLNGSIRITIGKISKKERDYVIKTIKESVTKLQRISPFKIKTQLNSMEVK